MREKSPWVAIWVEPRATIAKIVLDNPKQSLWYLAAIYGFSSLLNSFQSAALGNQIGTLPIFILALIFSPIWGYIVFSVWSWVVYWTGKLLKGGGDFQKVRAAYAWSCVPLLFNAILWIILIILFGRPLFSNAPQEHFLTNGQGILLFCILIGKVVLAIWSLVIYLNALAEVQQYSVLRAIGNVIIAGIIVGVVCGILWTAGMHAIGSIIEPSNTEFQILHELETILNIQGVL
jgi:hypothetical protein